MEKYEKIHKLHHEDEDFLQAANHSKKGYFITVSMKKAPEDLKEFSNGDHSSLIPIKYELKAKDGNDLYDQDIINLQADPEDGC